MTGRSYHYGKVQNATHSAKMIKAEDLLELYIVLPAVVISVLASVFGYLVYSVLFTSIEIGTQEPVYGDLTVCYKTGRGPYKNTGMSFFYTGMS